MKLTLLDDKSEQYFGNMRDIKSFNKPEGISEFFEKMSEVEKGNGEINEIYTESLEVVSDVVLNEPKPVSKRVRKKKLSVVVEKENI